MSGYARYFDKDNKFLNFLLNDKRLLKAKNAVWDKVSSLRKERFYSKLI